MPSLKWSPNAVQGLQRAYRFLAEYDLEVAKSAAKTVKKSAAILAKRPEAGRPADDLDPEHRELVVPFGASGYLLLYEVLEDQVLILAVKHQREAGS